MDGISADTVDKKLLAKNNDDAEEESLVKWLFKKLIYIPQLFN